MLDPGNNQDRHPSVEFSSSVPSPSPSQSSSRVRSLTAPPESTVLSPSRFTRSPPPPHSNTTPLPSTSTTTTTTNNNNYNNNINNKCAFCQVRQARDKCPATACLTCCKIHDCPVHQKSKEKAQFRSQILSGTTTAQKLWRQVQSQSVPKRHFRERAFAHVSDTLTVWDVRQFLLWYEEDGCRGSSSGGSSSGGSGGGTADATALTKRHHRDDAVRKSLRRKKARQIRGATAIATATTRNDNDSDPPKGGRRVEGASSTTPHPRASSVSSSSSSSRTERFRRLLDERLQRIESSHRNDANSSVNNFSLPVL